MKSEQISEEIYFSMSNYTFNDKDEEVLWGYNEQGVKR